MSRPMRLLFLALIAIAAGIATVAIMMLLQERAGQERTATETVRQVGGDFTLVDETGKTVTAADFRGKYMLIFFGYTNCPDVCPLTLQHIADALTAMPDRSAEVTPVFISVDPERDTPDKMKAYVGFFGPQFRGLTGSPQQVRAVLKAYGVYARKVPAENAKLAYTMDHSSLIYLYRPDGSFVTALDPSLDVAAFAAKLKENIKLPPTK